MQVSKCLKEQCHSKNFSLKHRLWKLLMIEGGASPVKINPLLANIAQDIATVATHYK